MRPIEDEADLNNLRALFQRQIALTEEKSALDFKKSPEKSLTRMEEINREIMQLFDAINEIFKRYQ